MNNDIEGHAYYSMFLSLWGVVMHILFYVSVTMGCQAMNAELHHAHGRIKCKHEIHVLLLLPNQTLWYLHAADGRPCMHVYICKILPVVKTPVYKITV